MKISRSRAIRLHCLDCAGSQKEVTLCHIASCLLWRYRFGNSMKGKAFSERMDTAKTFHSKDFIEMLPLLKAQLSRIKDKEVKSLVEGFLKKHKSLLLKKEKSRCRVNSSSIEKSHKNYSKEQ